MAIFSDLTLFERLEPLDGALQMAIDEILLSEASGVVFREYAWAEPTTSIGYFGACQDIREAARLLRRPTGGGMVEHGHGADFTYSIVIGADVRRELSLAPRESYRAIHRVLAGVLRDFGVAATTASDAGSGSGGQACFTNPVGDDLLLEGRKIAGAGQKRSRGAILHQGSIQPLELPDDFGLAFAAGLSNRVRTCDLDPSILDGAKELAESKYRTEAWTCRR